MNRTVKIALTVCRNSSLLSFPSCLFCTSVFKRFYYDKMETLDEDAIDDFTSQLIYKKFEKWTTFDPKRFKNKNHIILCHSPPPVIKNLSVTEIDLLLLNAKDKCDDKGIEEILLQCKKFQKLPSLTTALQILAVFSQKGDIKHINTMKEIYHELDPINFKKNSEFKHFLAEAIWMKGNFIEAINLIEEVYQNNINLRPRIMLMLKYLFHDGILNGSEAVLQRIIQFSEKIYTDSSDIRGIVLVWENCMLSNWFSDQSLALDLLMKYDELCESVTGLLSFIVVSALNNDQSDIVYRLLKLFLEKEKKTQALRIIISLFDYEVRKGDIQKCSEIIKWAEKNDISLPAIHHEKLVKLLIKCGVKRPKPVQNNKIALEPTLCLKF